MTKKEKYFYLEGYDRGVTIASWVEIPSWAEGPTDAREAMTITAGESERIDREFSPFEFTAREINTYGEWAEAHNRDPQAGWEAFETGIQDGIAAEFQDRWLAIRENFTERGRRKE